MTTPAVNVPRFTIRNYVRTLLFGYAVASAVVFLTSLDDESSTFGRLAVFVAVIGLVINTAIWGAIRLLRPWFRRAPERQHIFIHTLGLVAAGLIGFPIGYSLSVLIVHGRLPSAEALREPFAITLGVSLLVGLGMRAYMLLEQRLIASMERLKQHEIAEKELELARAIQQRLLPPGRMSGEGWQIDARNVPARFVAGDFYDAFPLADGRIALFVGDVAGKGIGASLIMASVKSVLPLLTREGSVAETMRALQQKLRSETGPREFVAVAHAVFDPRSGKTILANAALPDPYLIRTTGEVLPVVAGGNRLPLGVRTAADGHLPVGVTLDRGDRLLFFTDGLAEARVADGEQLGYDRLQSMLAGLASRGELSVETIVSALPDAADDDVTLLLLTRT